MPDKLSNHFDTISMLNTQKFPVRSDIRDSLYISLKKKNHNFYHLTSLFGPKQYYLFSRASCADLVTQDLWLLPPNDLHTLSKASNMPRLEIWIRMCSKVF